MPKLRTSLEELNPAPEEKCFGHSPRFAKEWRTLVKMSCKGIQPMLDAYRTNELESQERMLVESHLQSCPACASELRIIQDFVEPLKGLRSTAPAAVGNRVVDGLGDRI